MKPYVFLRADGNAKIGLGHVFRLLAFYQILKEQFECSFVCKQPDIALKELIDNAGCRLHVLDADADFDTQHPLGFAINKNSIIILDGYHFTNQYQSAVKKNFDCKLISIDDINAFPFIADAVINPAGGVDANAYQLTENAKLYSGPGYALLRPQFYVASAAAKNTEAHTQSALINFGGADPSNFTCEVLKTLVGQLPSTKIHVIVGAAYLHENELFSIADNKSNIIIHRNLDGPNLVQLMQQVDFAICSASTISYEYCSVSGILFIAKTADNQTSLYNFLVHEGLALPYEKLLDTLISTEVSSIKHSMVSKQRAYFDGQADKRLLKLVNAVYLKQNIHLSHATLDDVDIYFNWANDTEVRRNSFNQSPISYDTHCKWFNENVSSASSVFYIFKTAEHVPIANIRFKIEDEQAVLSYLIDERFRGLSLGKKILIDGAHELFDLRKDVDIIHGFVKHDNIASIKAFQSAGYQEVVNEDKSIRQFTINRYNYDKSV